MNDSGCRDVRDLLGVYVVGAIDPADRALADAHLSHCHRCREELAGLAGLPALLRRVPVPQAERLAAAGSARLPDAPPAELLSSLLTRLARRRKRRRTRTVFAMAAAVVIAAGAGIAGARAMSSGSNSASLDIVQAAAGPYHASIRYPEGNGTSLWVQVTGVQVGTTCQFWVVTKDGQRLRSGAWTAWRNSDQVWYQETNPVPSGQLAAFLITAKGQVLVRVPAT